MLLRKQADQRLAMYARQPERGDKRLKELERERDLERSIEVEGPITTLTGLFLGAGVSSRWLAVPLFRRWGIRTDQAAHV